MIAIFASPEFEVYLIPDTPENRQLCLDQAKEVGTKCPIVDDPEELNGPLTEGAYAESGFPASDKLGEMLHNLKPEEPGGVIDCTGFFYYNGEW